MKFTVEPSCGRPDFDIACNENDSSSVSSPSPLMLCLALRVAKTELLYTAQISRVQKLREIRTPPKGKVKGDVDQGLSPHKYLGT